MIRKVGVVGAGTMGSGIAQKIAQEGFDVVMMDIKEEFVNRGMERIRTTLEEAVQKRIFTEKRVEEILSRIEPTTNKSRLADCDLIIEAVFEDEKVKSELFAELNKICKKECIFATNTSSLSVASLSEASGRAERFVGMHYFYHPAKNRLLEVIGADKTDKRVVDEVVKFGELHGKTVIEVKDTPGFVVNRFFVPFLNEATRVVGEGLTNPRTVDVAAKDAFGIGMGPFELMNVTGIPIAYHSATSLGKELRRFYEPSDTLKAQFDKGRSWDIDSGEVEEAKIEEVKRRLYGAVFFVVTEMLDEGVATPADIDRGARIALRWAKGPFELMNEIGIKDSYRLVSEVCRRYGLSVPEAMEKQYKEGKRWQICYVDISVEDGVGYITVNRPEAMNSLNPTVIGQLKEAFRKMCDDERIKTVVFKGAGGKAFIAGADISFFIERIETGRFSEIYEFTEDGHKFLMEIESCPKRTIALVDGVALGGGLELALAADIIVATERSSFGFPETGIGIYPGLCGMPRVLKRIGKELGRYVVLTGYILNAVEAKTIGLIDYLCTKAESDEMVREVADATSPVGRTTPLDERVKHLPKKWRCIKKLFSDENIKRLMAGEVMEDDEVAEEAVKMLKRKAPVALKLAVKIMDEGYDKTVEEASRIELSYLKEVFSTDDALEGLQSVIERRRPTFKGS